MNASSDIKAISKRLQSELLSLMMSPVPGVSAFPESDNLMKWKATITGPEGTVFNGLEYKLQFEFPLVIMIDNRIILIRPQALNSKRKYSIQMLTCSKALFV